MKKTGAESVLPIKPSLVFIAIKSSLSNAVVRAALLTP